MLALVVIPSGVSVEADVAEESGHWRVHFRYAQWATMCAGGSTDGRGRPSGLVSSSYAAADAASEVRDGRVAPLDVIAIFAAGLALQVVLAFRVLAPHPFVVHVEPAKQALALAGCGDGYDDLPRSMDRISACHADSPSVRNLPRERSTRFTETALLPSGGRPRTRWATRTRFGDGLDGHYAISALTQPRKTTGHRAS